MKPLTLSQAGAAAANDATRGKRAARRRTRKAKRMRAAIAKQFRHQGDWTKVATVAPRGDARDNGTDNGKPPRVRFERPVHPLKRKCKRWSRH